MAEITSIFPKLCKFTVPVEITQDCELSEKFFIVFYSITNNTDDINSAPLMLFTYGGRLIENILPTGQALKQHILRAEMQASTQNDGLKKQRSCHIPTEWGLPKFDEKYIPF